MFKDLCAPIFKYLFSSKAQDSGLLIPLDLQL